MRSTVGKGAALVWDPKTPGLEEWAGPRFSWVPGPDLLVTAALRKTYI